MVYGIQVTSHGNYRCPVCLKRKVFKTRDGAINHVKREHPTHCEIWSAKDLQEKAEQRARAAEQKLKVYTEQQKQKPKQEYYDAHVFCTTCRHLSSCGMPKGVLPANVTCPNCGVCALHLVDNVAWWRAKS